MAKNGINNVDIIRILEFIARQDGMDCWFSIDDNGFFKDLEGITKSLRNGIKLLIEGMSYETFTLLSDKEKFMLTTFVAKNI